MLSPAMMRDFPTRVDNWSGTSLYYAITSSETRTYRSLNQFNVRPLILVMMYVIRDLAEENAFRNQGSVRLAHERWIKVREGIAIFLGRSLT